MKTLRIAMIAAFVAFAMVSLANTDDFKIKPTKKVVNMTINEAIKIPGLVVAMHQQLNEDFLKNNQPSYTKDVVYLGVIVRITGTFDQWKLFFRHPFFMPAEKYIEIDER
jgi:hypothetical protein